MIARRTLLRGIGALLAAPAVIPVYAHLMPVRSMGYVRLPDKLLWRDSGGGYLYSEELSDYLRVQLAPLVKFAQHLDGRDVDVLGDLPELFGWSA